MLWQQPDFFVELAKHGLYRTFPVLDAPLGELPSVLTDAFTPEYLVLLIYEDNADIRTVAFSVQHGPPQANSIQLPLIIRICRDPHHACKQVSHQHTKRSTRRSRSREPPAHDAGRNDPESGWGHLHLYAPGP